MADDLDLAASHSLRRMSLPAAATSGLIHALAALALVSSLPPRPVETHERAIDVTIEHAAPAPAALPVEEPTPEPARPSLAEMIPPPDAPPALDAAAEFPPPPALALETAPALPDLAAAQLEDVLPPVDRPPPFSTRELARAAPVPAKPRPVVQRAPVQPVVAERAPSQQRAQEDYLLDVIGKLSRYRFVPEERAASERGMVVTRVTIARDGRVVDVALARSSGFPALDRGVMDTIRRASPFPPLPPDVTGNQVSFTVPVAYNLER